MDGCDRQPFVASHKLLTLVKRELQLRNCLSQIGLWHVGPFLDCLLMEEDSPHCGSAVPGHRPGRNKKVTEQVGSKQFSSMVCSSSCSRFPP